MEDSERISGSKISNILDQAKKNRTILKIQAIDSGYDGLTMIIKINSEKMSFLIDYPGGFDSILPNTRDKRCYFEFGDQNKIFYSFSASIDKISKDKIQLKFPEYIERIQRRESFRITVPSGTKLFCNMNDIKFEFDVIDISEGGVLIGMKTRYHDKRFLYENGELSQFIIVAKNDDINVSLDIDSAEIVRLEKLKELGRYTYALKFKGIKKEEGGKIRRFINDCQRRILKQMGTLRK